MLCGKSVFVIGINVILLTLSAKYVDLLKSQYATRKDNRSVNPKEYQSCNVNNILNSCSN